MIKEKFAFDSARTEDENGFLHVKASHITKATVNPYLGKEIPGWRDEGLEPEKIYYALRDPHELQKSLPTWAGLPLQLGHHDEGADEEQAKDTRVGAIGSDVKWNEPYIDASLTIWDADAIKAVKDGSVRELSCAYAYAPDFTSGTFEGHPYDFVMRDIRGNHVALVPEGRAGHDVLVADAKPNFYKREDEKVIKKLAKDGDPAIEEKEVAIGKAIEKAGQKLQALHAEGPAGETIDKPDAETAPAPDAEDGLSEVMEKYKLDEAAIEEIKAALAGAQDEGQETDDTAQDEEEGGAATTEKNSEVDPEDKGPDATIRDAMEKCGLDADNPELAKAFTAGVSMGEKDDEEEKPAVDEDEIAEKAKDAALKALKVELSEKNRAAAKVAPLVGRVDPLTFDSAAAIYGYALKKLGISTAGMKPAAYDAALSGYMAAKFPRAKRRVGANDSRATGFKFEGNLKNIRIED